jgi:RNA recognition motif-containing protein
LVFLEAGHNLYFYPFFQVVRDKRTGKTKGYGFVSFSNPTDLAGAIKEMNGLKYPTCSITAIVQLRFCTATLLLLTLLQGSMLGTALLNWVKASGKRGPMLML